MSSLFWPCYEPLSFAFISPDDIPDEGDHGHRGGDTDAQGHCVLRVIGDGRDAITGT
jgi:hypothetical protein